MQHSGGISKSKLPKLTIANTTETMKSNAALPLGRAVVGLLGIGLELASASPVKGARLIY
jgi:hypothetical protein